MPDATPAGAPGTTGPEWRTAFRGIADGWIFSDVDGPLPAVAVLPLENPDLYDRDAADKDFEIVRRYRSVTVVRSGDREFGLLSAKLGAPAAAMVVEAAAARGVRALIGVGYCGAVAPEIGCGDLLVPSGAVSADGTSAGYCPERYPAVADRLVLAALHEAAAGRAHDGLVHSLDAVYTQDSALVERCRSLRVSGLDMETSAVLTVARLRGVRAATVLVASDHPGRGVRTDPALLTAGSREAMRVAREAVRTLAAQLD